MKLFIYLITFSFFIVQPVLGQEKTFTFKGQVHAFGETLKDARVEVLQGGELINEIITKGGGKFEFKLEPEKDYIVEISKEELQTKSIWINTKKTGSLTSKIPTFSFDVQLKKVNTTDYDELSEMPVTLIKYQPEEKVFFMDKSYEEAVKNKRKRIKETGLQFR